MTKRTIVLTESEVDHILFLIRLQEIEGTHYGNKKHYINRQLRIRKKLCKPIMDALELIKTNPERIINKTNR